MPKQPRRARIEIKGTGPRRRPPAPVTVGPPTIQDAIDAWRQSRSTNDVDVQTRGQGDTDPDSDESKPTS